MSECDQARSAGQSLNKGRGGIFKGRKVFARMGVTLMAGLCVSMSLSGCDMRDWRWFKRNAGIDGVAHAEVVVGEEEVFCHGCGTCASVRVCAPWYPLGTALGTRRWPCRAIPSVIAVGIARSAPCSGRIPFIRGQQLPYRVLRSAQTAAGSATEKVAPSPSRLSARIRPPWRWTMRWTSDRPTPVPSNSC